MNRAAAAVILATLGGVAALALAVTGLRLSSVGSRSGSGKGGGRSHC